MEQWQAVARWHELDAQTRDAQTEIKRLTGLLQSERGAQLRAAIAGQPGAVKAMRLIDAQLAQLAEQEAAVRGQIAEIQTLGAQLGTYCEACDWMGRTCSACANRARKAAQAPGGAVRFAPGGAVKSLTDGRAEILGIVWGGEDLEGDHFVRGVTDLGPMAKHGFKHLPIFYGHTLSGVKAEIGIVTYASEDEEGITFESELDKANRYYDIVARLMRARKMGSSTGAVGHTVVRKAGKLLRWHVGELSLDPWPQEPRTKGRAILR